MDGLGDIYYQWKEGGWRLQGRFLPEQKEVCYIFNVPLKILFGMDGIV